MISFTAFLHPHLKATAAREMLLEEYQSCTSSDAYPSPKRPRIGDSFADSSLLHTVESVMAENLVDTESELEPDDSLILSYIKEPNLAVYSDPIDSEKIIKKRNNPLEYWKQNEQSKPVLARLARTFLCAPPGSVASERLFSTAANIADGKRNRLLAEEVEMLLFFFKTCNYLTISINLKLFQ